jgi:serine/threonine protein kinase/tetratricopeptide (TPR) repeat protein
MAVLTPRAAKHVSPEQSPVWFGPYRLTSRIATGGMAEVYLGRQVHPDGSVGPLVALKRLWPHLVADASIVQMFLNEARITAQINHPNVVKILDLGHENGEPYIAMELLEGRSFAELRRHAANQAQRVPSGITLKILADACRGLDAAHRAVDEQGRFLAIVHRDFTPDNIHVGVNGEIKVIDFGIAKAQNVGSATEPGTLKGKFFYMSPEMIAGRPVDHRADIFAAGVMLYEQLCGRRPFTGSGPDEVMARIAQGTPRRPTECDPSVPPVLEAICLMAVSREPEKRFGSLSEFIHALESIGGIAQVAAQQDVANYVTRMFPEEKDPKRRTLRLARAAEASAPPAPEVLPAPVAQKAQKSPATLKRSTTRSSTSERWPMALVAGLLVGGGLVYWKVRPTGQSAADPGAGVGLLEELGSDIRTTAAQLKKAGNLLFSSAAYPAALRLSERFASRFPEDPAAPILEARSSIKLGMDQRAKAAIERTAALLPGEPESDLLASELAESQGDFPVALDAVGRALKKRPGSPSMMARRAYFLSQAGLLDDASEALSSVLQKKFDGESAAELGFVRLRQKNLSEAISLIRKAVKKEPKFARGHYYFGLALYAQGDLPEAEREYRQADQLAPEDPRALTALCEMYSQGGRKTESKGIQQLIATRFPREAPKLQGRCGR